jgi:ribosomal protein S7
MRDGKKTVAQSVVYDTFDILAKNPVTIKPEKKFNKIFSGTIQ